MSTAPLTSTGTLQHIRIPPQVTANRYAPSQIILDKVKPYLDGMPDEFWTDEAVERLTGAGFSYATTSQKSRLIVLLDWLGYRTVQAKPNRSGHTYRWRRDPDARIRPGSERLPSATVTPIDGLVTAMVMEEARASIAIDQGDIQTLTELPEDRHRAEPEAPAPVEPEADPIIEQTEEAGYERGLEEGMRLATEQETRATGLQEQYDALQRVAQRSVEHHREELSAVREAYRVQIEALKESFEQERANHQANWDARERQYREEVADLTESDDSWPLTDLPDSFVTLNEAARIMGLRIEVRARRA